MWIWIANKFAKVHTNRLNQSENIPKSFRRATFFKHPVHLLINEHDDDDEDDDDNDDGGGDGGGGGVVVMVVVLVVAFSLQPTLLATLVLFLMNTLPSLIKSLYFLSLITITSVNFAVSAHTSTSKQPAPLPPL